MITLNEYIVVEPIDREQEEQENLFLKAPDLGFYGIPNRGVIKFVQEGIGLGVGETIIFDEYTPRGFKWNGEKYLPIHSSKVLGVIS